MGREHGAIRLFRLIPPLLIFGTAASLLLWTRWYQQRRPSDMPQSLDPPRFQSPTLPLPPPRRLEAETLEHFVRWVAAVPVSEVQVIRHAISAARKDDSVFGALVASIFQLPVMDFGRHQLLLSILGELQHPKSVEPLAKFIDLPGDTVVPRPPPDQSKGLFTSYLDYAGALQARAVEMLAFMKTGEALAAVLQIAASHTSRTVRLAALDAFVFNHGDSAEAIEKARAVARPEEAKMVGLPRRTRDFDPREFDGKVRAFYQRYPEENPPHPEHSRREWHNRFEAGPPGERRKRAMP
jgi:hypothetical protein